MAKLIRLPEVKARTGLSRTAIYSGTLTGKFPKQIPIGTRSVGWIDDEIDAWVNSKIESGKKQRSAK